MKFSSPFVFGLGLGLGVTVGVGAVVGASQLGSSVFPDVPSGAYYDQAVGRMYSLGIITGFGDGSFRPEDNATRGQIAVINERTIDYIFDELNHTPREPVVSSSSSSSSTSSSSTSSSSASSVSSVTVPEEGGFRFTTTNYNVDEDGGEVNVTVVRTGGSKGLAGVQYTVTADSATEGEDYELTSGTLNFAEGETSNQFAVTILNDTDEEGDEKFTVTLSDATGGAVVTSPAEATVTIKDDDEASGGGGTSGGDNPQGTFNFSAVTYGVAEDGLSAVVTVERQGGSQGSVSIDYNMNDGTADSSNYTKESGTLSFGDGETSKTFTVKQKSNNEVNGNKTVNLSLTNPTGGAVLGDYKTAVLTIYDDDIASYGTGSFRFSNNEYQVVESDGEAIITVERIRGAASEVNVKFETSAGTATEGIDYEEVDITLTFRDGETGKVVIVPILNDTSNDNDETVNLKLKEPTGGADLEVPSIATLRIY